MIVQKIEIRVKNKNIGKEDPKPPVTSTILFIIQCMSEYVLQYQGSTNPIVISTFLTSMTEGVHKEAIWGFFGT